MTYVAAHPLPFCRNSLRKIPELTELKQAVGGRPPQYAPSPVTLTFDL